MCGIVGIVSLTGMKQRQIKESWFTRALFVDTLRGFDSTGIFAVPYKELDQPPLVYKRALAAPDFLCMRKSEKIIRDIDEYFCLIGHNRAATMGGINDRTAHPFQHGKITLIHNGTLNSRLGLTGTNAFAVDSEDICYSLSKVEDPKIILESLNGAFALIWYNHEEQSLHIARNDERTLYYALDKTGENLFFASEPWMIHAGFKPDAAMSLQGPWLLKKGLHLTCKPTHSLLSDFELEEFDIYQPPVTYNTNGYYNNTGYTANSLLRQYGYELNELVKFEVTRVNLYRSTQNAPGGPTCSIAGKTIPIGQSDYPKDATVAYNIPVKYITNGREYTSVAELLDMAKETIWVGRVSNASNWNRVFELTLKDIHIYDSKELREKNKDPEPEDVGLTHNQENLPAVILPNNAKVAGPDGNPITVRKFNKLVKRGCAWCSCNIYPEDADNILWLQNGEVICPDCVELDELTSYTHQ